MQVFARRSLAAAVASDAGFAAESSLLLEGSWADQAAGGSPTPSIPHALDDAIDGRFAALDADAQQIAAAVIAAADPGEAALPNFAELNALRLRYAIVKWLRPIAWRRHVFTGDPREPVRLVVESPRDAEYEILFRELAAADGFSLSVERPTLPAPVPPIALPPNPFWRRLAGRALSACLGGGRVPTRNPATPRVLLSGNPRLLDPICAELVDRGAIVAWLYDRFSFGCSRRWHRCGVTQLVCNSSLGPDDRFPPRLCREPLFYAGVDLAPVVNAWYDELRCRLGPSQARLWSEIGRHVADFRPTQIVVDEDATPQSRAAIHHGRRVGATSTVVQHGICGVRFGFAPLLADAFCAWDDGSRRQMEAWGVPPHAITVTGSPYQERVAATARRSHVEFSSAGGGPAVDPPRPPRVLLIGTIPPRDDRPDSIAYHLTTRHYEKLLEAALAGVAGISHDELAIRNHPRTGVDRALARQLAYRQGLRVRDTSRVPIADDLAMSDVVLSFPSSGALDAVRLGKPVIQLAPVDSHEVAPAEWYGFFGTAGTLPQLRALLAGVLAALPRSPGCVSASSATEPPRAAAAVVDVVLRTSNRRRSGDAPDAGIRYAAEAIP